MSKLFYLFLAMVMSLNPLWAQGVQWRSWNAGLQEAKATGKIIMIDAMRSDCHYCEEMEIAVFQDSAMAAEIEKDFVPVKINLSEEALPLGLQVSMTPTFFFISKEGSLLKKVPGSWNQTDFRSFLEGVKR